MKRGIIPIYKTFSVLIFVILAASIVSSSEYNFTIPQIDNPSGANIRIVTYNYEPDPVEPGEQFELWIKVMNLGTKAAIDARCRVVIDNPFYLYMFFHVAFWESDNGPPYAAFAGTSIRRYISFWTWRNLFNIAFIQKR